MHRRNALRGISTFASPFLLGLMSFPALGVSAGIASRDHDEPSAWTWWLHAEPYPAEQAESGKTTYRQAEHMAVHEKEHVRPLRLQG